MIFPILVSVLALTACSLPLPPAEGPATAQLEATLALASDETTPAKGLTSILVYSRTTGFRHGSIGRVVGQGSDVESGEAGAEDRPRPIVQRIDSNHRSIFR